MCTETETFKQSIAKDKKKIVIYGAGMVGELVFRYLKIEGYEEKVCCFAISGIPVSDMYYGRPVLSIEQLLTVKEDVLVIIAAFPYVSKEMQTVLKKYGFPYYKIITKKLFHGMSQIYMEDFKQRNSLAGETDVLMFASDNNRTSGAFLCMADTVFELLKKNIRCLVVLPEYGNGETVLIEKKIEFTYIPSNTWLKRVDGKKLTWQESQIYDYEKSIGEIKEIITKRHIKIVHCNTTYTNIGAVVAFKMKIPVIWHLRENIAEQGYSFKNENQAFELINKSYAIITVSNYLSQCYSLLRKEKNRIIYDGVDVERYYYKHKLFQYESCNIIMAGAIYPLKGQLDLVKAASILKEKNIKFKIDFIGSGDEDYLKKLREETDKYKLRNYITFLGRKDNLEEFYRKADISIICSRSESFGRVCIESQLSGCIVIGADRGATVELIDHGKTGIIYKCGNAEDLAYKITNTIERKYASQSIALQGQENAYKKFTREKSAEQVFGIYKEIL